jgi:hypothetical protein
MTDLEIACQALFTGRINVPRAALIAGITPDEMKIAFKDYVKARGRENWELDITPCWPYA